MAWMSLSIIWKCICFGFFGDKVRWPMMQYKISPIDVLRSPKDGLAI
jgi:hypothetical protein